MGESSPYGGKIFFSAATGAWALNRTRMRRAHTYKRTRSRKRCPARSWARSWPGGSAVAGPARGETRPAGAQSDRLTGAVATSRASGCSARVQPLQRAVRGSPPAASHQADSRRQGRTTSTLHGCTSRLASSRRGRHHAAPAPQDATPTGLLLPRTCAITHTHT